MNATSPASSTSKRIPLLEVVFWEVPTGREVAVLEWDPNAVVTDVAFSPDNEMLATAQRGGIIKLWPWRRLLDA